MFLTEKKLNKPKQYLDAKKYFLQYLTGSKKKYKNTKNDWL